MGCITGTIIDTRTGAPAPNITVIVGGALVTSNANGNYDTWVPVGNYTVALMLSSQQGTDSLGPQAVAVRMGDITVQHLFFRSTLVPTATVAQPTTSSTDTGAVNAGGSSASPAAPNLRPKHLPLTSVPANNSMVWLSLGTLLVLAGTVVGWGSRVATKRAVSRGIAAAQPDDSALLATLLAQHPQPSSSCDTILLWSLLSEDSKAEPGD